MEINDYIRRISSEETSALKALRVGIEQACPRHENMISVETGAFLTFFVQAIGAKRILEIGTYGGYSALALALGMPEDGSLITLDKNKSLLPLALKHWEEAGIHHKISFVETTAAPYLKKLAEESALFDFIFIDADKKSYQQYVDSSLQLLKPAGILAVDNTLGFKQCRLPTCDHPIAQALMDFNVYVKEHPRLQQIVLPLGDGITFCRVL